MRAKLIIALLLFVLIPTALLSFMAARALRSWELALEQRMELEAASTVQSVAARLDDRIRQPLEQIVAAVAGVQARGAMAGDMARTARRLEESSGWVHCVYVFMNPWDFLHPPAPAESTRVDGRTRAQPMTPRELLLGALRRNIASASSPAAPLRFRVDERMFVFHLVSMGGLYAGYEIDAAHLRAAIREEVVRASDLFLLCAEGPDWAVSAPGCPTDRDEVEVVDSLTGLRTRAAADAADARSLQVAEVQLGPPLADVRIRAFLSDPSAARRRGALRARLYGWSILLLALAILAGVGFALHAAVVELRQARARSQYVIGVSHDLRTPLASLTMLTESLYEERIADPAKRKEFLGTILRECERLNQLIERVLFFVRYGQKALVFHREEADVGVLVNEAVDAVVARSGGGYSLPVTRYSEESAGSEGERIDESSAIYRTVGEKPRIRVVVQEGLPLVRIDRRAMMQVLLNLLDNAEKYGKRQPASHRSSGRPLDIDVRADRVKRSHWGRRREWVRMAVRDFGTGLEPGARKRIFAPFYRTPRAGAANVSGVGVGLALCRHVVRAHGGRIEVESEEGKGCTFFVLLPVERVDKTICRQDDFSGEG